MKIGSELELEWLEYALELGHPQLFLCFCSITKNCGFILDPVRFLRLKRQQSGLLKKMEFWQIYLFVFVPSPLRCPRVPPRIRFSKFYQLGEFENQFQEDDGKFDKQTNMQWIMLPNDQQNLGSGCGLYFCSSLKCFCFKGRQWSSLGSDRLWENDKSYTKVFIFR